VQVDTVGTVPPTGTGCRYGKVPTSTYPYRTVTYLPTEGTVRYTMVGRVADPVHFRPDPDPANQNFKSGFTFQDVLVLRYIPLQLARKYQRAFTMLWCHSDRIWHVTSFEAVKSSLATT